MYFFALPSLLYFSVLVIYGMELEFHDSHYIVHVADECPIIPAQFVQSIDGNWTGLLGSYLWVC